MNAETICKLYKQHQIADMLIKSQGIDKLGIKELLWGLLETLDDIEYAHEYGGQRTEKKRTCDTLHLPMNCTSGFTQTRASLLNVCNRRVIRSCSGQTRAQSICYS